MTAPALDTHTANGIEAAIIQAGHDIEAWLGYPTITKGRAAGLRMALLVNEETLGLLAWLPLTGEVRGVDETGLARLCKMGFLGPVKLDRLIRQAEAVTVTRDQSKPCGLSEGCLNLSAWLQLPDPVQALCAALAGADADANVRDTAALLRYAGQWAQLPGTLRRGAPAPPMDWAKRWPVATRVLGAGAGGRIPTGARQGRP